MNNPVEANDYKEYADQPLDDQNHEALVANAEQDSDMNQAIRHTMYIGWIMGVTRESELRISHAGGNKVQVSVSPTLWFELVIPYPPENWKP